MKKLLVFFAALALVLAYATPAKASCEHITIGASISFLGIYQENNLDYNDDVEDAVSSYAEYVDIYLENEYTDNVKTYVEMDLSSPFNDHQNRTLEVEQAYIEMKEFLNPNLTLKIGKMNVKWELRPTWGAGTLENLYPEGVNGSLVLNGYPTAICVTYAFNEDITVTFAMAKCIENSFGGSNSDDLDLYLVRYDQNLQDNGNFFVAVLYYNDLDGNLEYYDAPTGTTHDLLASIWMVDFGIDYFLQDESLELYFEGVYQDGDSDANIDFGTVAINCGAEYTFKDSETVPYVGLDFTFFQGQDDDTVAFQRINTDWTRTLIAENDFFGGLAGWSAGAVLTPGYFGIKLVAGMKNISNEKFAVDFIVGYFQADGDLNSTSRDDALGWEADAIVSYMYTEDVTFTLGFGYFDPDEELSGAIGVADPDGVWTAVVGCTIIF